MPLVKRKAPIPEPIDPDELPEITSVTPEEKQAEPAQGMGEVRAIINDSDTAKCEYCLQQPSACENRHAVVELVKPLCINGVLYGEGLQRLPENAFGVFKYAVKG